jgi:ElaB/YqjD/DUF883 family membrane-anchored ribosome-binding protein
MADDINKDSTLNNGSTTGSSGGSFGNNGSSPNLSGGLTGSSGTSGLSSSTGSGATGASTLGGLSSSGASTLGGSSSGASTTDSSSSFGGSGELIYADTATGASTGGSGGQSDLKTHFSAAIEEAKKGVAALKTEAGSRASTYKDQARDRSQDYSQQAKEYSLQAKTKVSELAVDGKTKASEALRSLSTLINDNAASVDGSLGAKYGDYARTASQSLTSAADKLDQKSVEELGEDTREYIRTNPGTAVGIAALAGFLIARTFGGSRKKS